MRILEVTAVPPKIYGVSLDGTVISSFIDTVKGALSYWISGDGRDMLAMSNPTPREIKPVKLTAVGLDAVAHSQTLGTMWFEEDKGYTGNEKAHKTNYTSQIFAVDDDARYKNLTGDLLSDLNAVSMSQNAINYWEVPDYYIGSVTRDSSNYSPDSDVIQGQIKEISSKIYNGTVQFAPPVPVYNNKARYCQSANITVYNPCSGASLTKNIFDLLQDGTDPGDQQYSLQYVVGADIRPNGCPIFSWKFNDGGGSQLMSLTQTLKGGPWVKIPLSSNGLNGSYFQRLQQRDKNAMVVGGAIALGASALAGGITGIGTELASASERGLLSGAVKGQNTANAIRRGFAQGFGVNKLALGGWAVATYQQLNQQALLNARGICATYPQFIGASDYAQDVNGNKFCYCISSYRGDDLLNFDAFLERFGYYVGNMVIGTQHFWSREQFIYIKINDMTISSAKAGKVLKDEVIDQLQAGVRIWRHKPNITALNPGGNRTVPTDCPVQ